VTIASPRSLIALLDGGDRLVCTNDRGGGVTWSLLHAGTDVDGAVVQSLRDGLFLDGHLVPCGDGLFVARDSQTWRWKPGRRQADR